MLGSDLHDHFRSFSANLKAEANPMTLEQTISFIREDELVEVTPRSIRMRKGVLSAQKRHLVRSAKIKKLTQEK